MNLKLSNHLVCTVISSWDESLTLSLRFDRVLCFNSDLWVVFCFVFFDLIFEFEDSNPAINLHQLLVWFFKTQIEAFWLLVLNGWVYHSYQKWVKRLIFNIHKVCDTSSQWVILDTNKASVSVELTFSKVQGSHGLDPELALKSSKKRWASPSSRRLSPEYPILSFVFIF